VRDKGQRSIEGARHKPGGKSARSDVEVVTLFAASMDIVWYQSPKFSEEDEGI
jgi:hypothetical protein